MLVGSLCVKNWRSEYLLYIVGYVLLMVEYSETVSYWVGNGVHCETYMV